MEDLSMQMSCMQKQQVNPKVARLERKFVNRGNIKQGIEILKIA